MKYLKYILGIIAVLVIIFLALGLLKPEISYDCEIVVDKPISESWAVTQDEEKLKDWLPTIQKIEHISGTPGTVGAVSDVHFDNDGQMMTIRETITDLVPEKSISMTYTSDFMNMDYTLNMADENGKTKIYTSTTTEGNGMISKSMMVLIAGSIEAQEETNLANLKETIEKNIKDY